MNPWDRGLSRVGRSGNGATRAPPAVRMPAEQPRRQLSSPGQRACACSPRWTADQPRQAAAGPTSVLTGLHGGRREEGSEIRDGGLSHVRKKKWKRFFSSSWCLCSSTWACLPCLAPESTVAGADRLQLQLCWWRLVQGGVWPWRLTLCFPDLLFLRIVAFFVVSPKPTFQIVSCKGHWF